MIELIKEDYLTEKLLELLKSEENICISITGEWGIGKTYFWKNFEKKKLEKKVAYVSLFGKDKLSDIESDIIMQVSKVTKIREITNKSIGKVGMYGFSLSNILSVIPQSDFKNIVICIDDFERKSNKLDSKDILGVISKFKEEKNCQIVMIFEKNKIEKEIFSEYKEKIIDFEFQYNPTTEEVIRNVSDKLKIFKDDKYLIRLLANKKIRNIRIIKKIIRDLNNFAFIGKEIEKYEKTKKKFLDILVCFSIVYSKNLEFDLDKYKSSLKNKEAKDNDFHREINNILNGIYIDNPLVIEIDYYFRNLALREDKINDLINTEIKAENKENKENEYSKDFNNNYNNLIERCDFDLNYSHSDFKKEAKELLDKYEIKPIIIYNYLAMLEKLILIENDNSTYKEFALKKIKAFINSSKKAIDMYLFRNFYKYDSNLEDDIIEHNKRFINNTEIDMTREEKIIKIIDEIIFRNSKKEESAFLLDISAEEFKELIIKSNDLYKKIFEFLDILTFQGYEEYLIYSKNIRTAIQILKSDEKYKEKIEKLFHKIFETFDYYEENNYI